MAGLTIEAAVRPCQGISCLSVVIKAPYLPAIGIVAERAIRTQTTLMMLVGMAGGAIQRRALELQRTMAALTRYDRMASD